MESDKNRANPALDAAPARRPYQKPTLTGFGLIRDLTANGSGVMSETTQDCSKNKIFLPACMGQSAPDRTRGS